MTATNTHEHISEWAPHPVFCPLCGDRIWWLVEGARVVCPDCEVESVMPFVEWRAIDEKENA